MAGNGIGLVLNMLKKNPAFSSQSIHSYSFFSAPVATTAAAASAFAFFPNYPSFASQFFFSGAGSIAYCDAGAVEQDDIEYSNSNIYNGYKDHSSTSNYVHRGKTYNVELKPLFSAFGLKTLGLTTLRALLLFYLPVLERYFDEDDDDLENFDDVRPDSPSVDLVLPLKKSVKQICRETAVLTTRRVLERLVVHHVSQRMAWKLLKDVPKSAQRKACRHMPLYQFFFCVSKSTFRGHVLGVAASWLVQVGLDFFHCVSDILKDENRKEENQKDENQSNRDNPIQRFKERVLGTTVRCGASLVFASIGAGLGATIRPSSGQWIGCAVGDTAGPLIVGFCLGNLD